LVVVPIHVAFKITVSEGLGDWNLCNPFEKIDISLAPPFDNASIPLDISKPHPSVPSAVRARSKPHLLRMSF
jgi:hypothetical protein